MADRADAYGRFHETVRAFEAIERAARQSIGATDELIVGSRRAIDESRELLAKATALLAGGPSQWGAPSLSGPGPLSIPDTDMTLEIARDPVWKSGI